MPGGSLARSEVSLRERIEEITEDKLPSLKQSQEELIQEAEDEFGSFAQTPPEYEQTWNKLEEKRTEMRGKALSLARFIAENETDIDPHDEDDFTWEDLPEGADCVFTVREMTGGELAMVEDEVSEESFDVDPEAQTVDGVPKGGLGRVVATKTMVDDWPDWCDTDERGRCNVADFPWRVQQELYELANNVNTVGDQDLGNTSLREAMQSNQTP